MEDNQTKIKKKQNTNEYEQNTNEYELNNNSKNETSANNIEKNNYLQKDEYSTSTVNNYTNNQTLKENNSFLTDIKDFVSWSKQDWYDFKAVSRLYLKYFSKSWIAIVFVIIIPIFYLIILSFFPYNFDIQKVLIPVLAISIIIVPITLVDFRSSTIIKRIGVVSIPKLKFNFFLVVINLIIIVTLVLIFLFCFLPLTSWFFDDEIGNSFDASINSIFVNGVGWDTITWWSFFTLLILVSIAFIEMGIFLGMKFQNKINTLLITFLIFLTISFCSGMFFGSWLYIDSSLNNAGIASWIYAITPWTFIMASLIDSLYGVTNVFYYCSSIIVILTLIFLSIVFNNKIISYSSIR